MPYADPVRRAAYMKQYRATHIKRISKNARDYNKTPRHRFNNHRAYCKTHGLEFTITLEEYSALEGVPCHYCGFPRPATGIGLDRIDNDGGYTPGNVLPCCSECNRARNAYFTVEEMREIIGPAVRLAKQRRGAVATELRL